MDDVSPDKIVAKPSATAIFQLWQYVDPLLHPSRHRIRLSLVLQGRNGLSNRHSKELTSIVDAVDRKPPMETMLYGATVTYQLIINKLERGRDARRAR